MDNRAAVEIDCIPKLITEQMNEILCRPFERLEVDRVLKELPTNKAPGPDGFSSEFYKQYWDIVGDDFMDAVSHFQSTGQLPTQWKSAFITLIPKKENPVTPRDYRPISLCNVSYKIISKVIVNRLKPYLSSLISEEQSAFVNGRLITDNIFVVQELVHSMQYRRSEGELMGIKLDMERAYDLMRWDYIEAVLLQFGFWPDFVNLIMGCVRGASFAVLVNGSPSNWFKSTMGLRQGDPLSPYLFILCSEVLLRKLKNARAEGLLSGFQCGENGETIGALMYADDSILVAKATPGEAMRLSNIIKNYCEVSGQLVNFEKSTVLFGKNVSRSCRKRCCRVLAMREAGTPFKYLGVFIGSKRLPASCFEPLLDRLRGKMKSWKAKVLSFAGKLTLIKSVLCSMPIHILSCTWVPKSVIAKIEMLLRQFLWAQDGDHRGLPLVSWEVICRPKSEGGLGVHNLENTREALMGKQLARVVGGDSNPAARLLRWKYRVHDVWEPTARRGASAGWRAIQSGTEVVRMGLRWCVGDGQSINLWSAPWLGASPLSKWPTYVNCNSETAPICVSDLIRDGSWDNETLHSLFSEFLCNQIREIALPISELPDRLLWRGKPLRDFSTKEAYSILSTRSQVDTGLGTWKWVWKLLVSERVRAWIWKVGQRCVPTKAFLYRRGMVGSLRCQRCLNYAEDLFHLLVDCSFSRDIWAVVTHRFALMPFEDGLDSWWSWFKRGGQDDASAASRDSTRSLIAYVAWEVWKQRNASTFRNDKVDISTVIDKAIRQWKEQCDLRAANYSLGSSLRSRDKETAVRWDCPDEGWIKLNFDGSVDGMGVAGTGFIVRDTSGRPLVCGGKYISECRDINEVELRAVWQGMVHIRRTIPCIKLWVEGDSLNVIKLLQGLEVCHNLALDVRSMLNELSEFKLTHIYREGNASANWIANFCRACGSEVVWDVSLPVELQLLVDADAYGVNYIRE